jgi:hypothetical protein
MRRSIEKVKSPVKMMRVQQVEPVCVAGEQPVRPLSHTLVRCHMPAQVAYLMVFWSLLSARSS